MSLNIFPKLLIAVIALAACADQTTAPAAITTRLPAAFAAASAGPQVGFGFNGSAGVVRLTGGGSFDPATRQTSCLATRGFLVAVGSAAPTT